MVDNFEQLLDAAPALGAILAASPRSKLVVTSRAPLRLAAEHELALAAARPPSPRSRCSSAAPARSTRGCSSPTATSRVIARICRAPRRPPAGDRARRRADQGPHPRRDPRPALAPARPAQLRPARRAAAPADAARRDRLELRPARPRRAAAVQRSSASSAGGFTLDGRRDRVRPGRARRHRRARRPQPADPRRRPLRDARDRARVRAREARSRRADAVRDRHARAYAELVRGRRATGCDSAEHAASWLRAPRRRPRQHPRRAAPRRSTRGDADTARRARRPAVALLGHARRGSPRAASCAAPRSRSAAARPELRLRAANGAGILAAEQGDFDAARAHFEESLALAPRARRRATARPAPAPTSASSRSTRGDFETAIAPLRGRRPTIARELGDERTDQPDAAEPRARLRRRRATRARRSRCSRRASSSPAASAIPRTSARPSASLARVLLDDDRERARDAAAREPRRSRSELRDANAIVACLETAARARRADPRTGAQLWGAADQLRREARRDPPARRAALRATRVEATLRAALGDGRASRPRSPRARRCRSSEAVKRALATLSQRAGAAGAVAQRARRAHTTSEQHAPAMANSARPPNAVGERAAGDHREPEAPASRASRQPERAAVQALRDGAVQHRRLARAEQAVGGAGEGERAQREAEARARAPCRACRRRRPPRPAKNASRGSPPSRPAHSVPPIRPEAVGAGEQREAGRARVEVLLGEHQLADVHHRRAQRDRRRRCTIRSRTKRSRSTPRRSVGASSAARRRAGAHVARAAG